MKYLPTTRVLLIIFITLILFFTLLMPVNSFSYSNKNPDLNNYSTLTPDSLQQKSNTRSNHTRQTGVKNLYFNDEIHITSSVLYSDSNIIINSTGNVIIESTGSLILKNTTLKFNASNIDVPSITVKPNGGLDVINSSISANKISLSLSPDKLDFQISCESNSIITMINSQIEYSNNKTPDAEFVISTSNVNIQNCNFINGYIGLKLHNVSNVTIIGCTFSNNNYDVEVNKSNDVRFFDCTFWFNDGFACNLVNAGNIVPITLENCSIIDERSIVPHENIDIAKGAFKLISSNLTTINVTDQYASWLDVNSNINVYWYLNLLTVDNNKKPLKSVNIKIIDDSEIEIFTGKSDENGRLNWIQIKEKTISKYLINKHNPHKIIAKKKGKTEYSKSEWITININNTAQSQTIKLDKKEKDNEADLQDTLYVFCICFMVIITVFIMLMAINIYLARKKAGIYGLNQYKTGSTKPQPSTIRTKDNLRGEIITCSECGTEITEDAKFCPHCGEYFEGDEFECSGCGNKLAGDATSCPKCGKIFETDQKSGKKHAIKQENLENKLFCSECGAVVVRLDKKCPGCGLLFSGSNKLKDSKDQKLAKKITAKEEIKLKKQKEIREIIGDESFMCSVCGADVNEESKKCKKCGTEFD